MIVYIKCETEYVSSSHTVPAIVMDLGDGEKVNKFKTVQLNTHVHTGYEFMRFDALR